MVCGVWCVVWFVYIQVYRSAGGGVKLYGGDGGVMYDTRGIMGGVVDTV